ncbi:MAG: hypothetical protein WKF58_19945 [Ilumatobacteraceae bacterium]
MTSAPTGRTTSSTSSTRCTASSATGSTSCAATTTHTAARNGSPATQWIELPGVAVALLDTTIPQQANGTLRAEQLEWLDERAAASTVPVLVMGHHHQWLPPAAAHGIEVPISEGDDVLRHRSGGEHAPSPRCASGGRRSSPTRVGTRTATAAARCRAACPSIEVGCVKDFPGTWAEYRVFEGGVLQVVHRISSPEALEWSERCRVLYSDFGLDYTGVRVGDPRRPLLPHRPALSADGDAHTSPGATTPSVSILNLLVDNTRSHRYVVLNQSVEKEER